ncbi:MAG: Fic family protein [Chitinophagales bacterium]
MESYKKGTYRQQYQYKCFVPPLLDQPFEWRSDAVLSLVSKASEALGALNVYAELLPDVSFFIEMHKIKEATTSSRIEGTRTNIDEAVLSEKDIAPEKKDDWQEVRNYIDALNYAIERADKLPLSMRLLREAHEILLSGVRGERKRPGEIRSSQNWIGGTNLENAMYIPPHDSLLPELLGDLEKFWHNTDWQLPPLIRIAISHYQFEAIHPFLDGNGRIGRLLIILQMLEYGILNKPIFYISAFIEKYRGEYYDALLRVTKSADMDQWLKFFLSVVIETAEDSKRTLSAIESLRSKYHELTRDFGRRSQLARQLINKLYSEPIVSPRRAEEMLGVVPATANALLKEMEKAKILLEISGQSRNRRYMLHEYIDLFRK